MIPDPNTPEGREEIARRAKKRLKEIRDIKDRAKGNPDEEPSGKLTNPNDIDRVKDRRKGND
ncbi:hypothetical protein [Marinimicrobium locisalis]|uniref:hypothetical protein n=1 Tax=Marinimicrobium locisalis TaxID=546022 RepID=UPI0032217F58